MSQVLASMTVISAFSLIKMVYSDFSILPVIRSKTTIVAIPIAIPTIAKTLLVLFLKGFFNIKLIYLIKSSPN